MKMFVLPDVRDKANTLYKLIKFDLTKAETCLLPKLTKFGTATNENLKSVYVSNEVKLKFRKDCLKAFKSTSSKVTRKISFKIFLYQKRHVLITHFYGH